MTKLLLAALGFAVFLQGQENALTLEQAKQQAIEKNLSLMAERANLPIADARILQAGLRPNPVFSYGSDYIDTFYQGFTLANNAGPPEWNIRVDYPIEGGKKRERRLDLAKAQKSVAELQLLNTIRQLVLDVSNAFVDVQVAKESLALAKENLGALNSVVEINTARAKAGDLAEVELMRSRLAARQFQASVQQAELRLRSAKVKLQLLIGRTKPDDGFDVSGPIRADQQTLDVEAIRKTAFERRPDLLAIQKDQARSVADLRLQVAQGKVDYSVGTMFHRQYGPVQSVAMGFFFSVPIPVYNRNQGEIERAKREDTQIQTRIRALNAQIETELRTAFDQYQTSKALVDSIEKNMLDQAREVRRITEYSYRRGEASFVEFLDAQRAFNDTMQTYNDARADYARNLYLLESVSGKGVNP